MAFFRKVALVKAPLAMDMPTSAFMSDITEVCYLAAVLEGKVEHLAIPVDIYGRDPFKQFWRYLKKHRPDFVGISSMTGGYRNALRMARIAKEFRAFVALGGYHPSAMPDKVLASPYVDAVVRGEGEMTLVDLVINGPGRPVKGLSFKDEGNIVHNPDRELIDNLDDLPMPLRSLRPPRFGRPGDDYHCDTVYTSRGCPNRCTFCANSVVHKRWRARSPENVVEELALLHRKDFRREVKIYDANFMTDIERVNRIADLMIENGLTNFKIYLETRVIDIVKGEDTIKKLREVGLYEVGLGIESPDPVVLKKLKKGVTHRMTVKAIEILNRHHVRPGGFFIIGHEDDRPETIRGYTRYAEDIGLGTRAIFFIMTPYPGTKVFEEAHRAGKIIRYNWDLYNNFCPTMRLKHIDLRTMRRLGAECNGGIFIRGQLQKSKYPHSDLGKILGMLIVASFMHRLEPATTRTELCDNLYACLEGACGSFESRRKPKKRKTMLSWIFRQSAFVFPDPTAPQRRGIMLSFDVDDGRIRSSLQKFDKTLPDTGHRHHLVIDLNRIHKLERGIDFAKLMYAGRTLKEKVGLRTRLTCLADLARVATRGAQFFVNVIADTLRHRRRRFSRL